MILTSSDLQTGSTINYQLKHASPIDLARIMELWLQLSVITTMTSKYVQPQKETTSPYAKEDSDSETKLDYSCQNSRGARRRLPAKAAAMVAEAPGLMFTLPVSALRYVCC